MSRQETEQHTPPVATGFVAAVFLLVLAGGVLLGASAIARLDRTPEGSLRTGELTSRLEAAFEEALPIYEPALHLWTAFRYAAFGEGGPGLVVGTGGWLFTAEELETYPDELARLRRAASYVAQVRRELAGRDAALAVVLLPSKARIYEDRLPGFALPEAAAARYDRALRLMHRAVTAEGNGGQADRPGFTVVDPRAALQSARATGTEVFLRTDTHWTPAGAAVVAQALAGEVGPFLERQRIARTPFETEAAGTVTHRGDLLRFLPLGPFAEALGPRPDSVVRYETRPAEEGAAGGLFDEPTIPVTLVGTSYSADELWNFAGAVSHALEADVLTVAAEGEGPFAPMAEYLESETIVDQPPGLVIWEIPERYLVRVAAARGGRMR
jgi:alginate O-acetyltransferase complex protein AlgJ